MIIKRILDKFHVGIILDSEIIHFHPFSTKWANILNHPEFHYWPLRWSPRCASIVPSLLVSQNGHANVLESSIWIIQSLIIGFTYERNCNSLGWIPRFSKPSKKVAKSSERPNCSQLVVFSKIIIACSIPLEIHQICATIYWKKKLKDTKNNAELEDVSISKFENTKKNMKNLVPIENWRSMVNQINF